VSREELRAKLWPVDTFVDFDNSVNASINRLREALGDSADNPRFIQTLPRRGYRFIAPVSEAPVSVEGLGISISQLEAAAPSQTLPIREHKLPGILTRSRWTKLTAALGLSLTLVASALWIRRGWHTPTPQPETYPAISAIAVLPLENLSEDSAQEYFADGIMDGLTTDLAQAYGLRVVSRTSAMQFKGVRKPLPQIARELNVDGIVEAAVSRSGEHVRINAKLIYAPADRHLWAQSYDGDVKDIIAMEMEIAGTILKQLQPQMPAAERARLTQTRPINPQAFDLYLEGRFYSDHVSRTDIDHAIAALRKSVQLDPQFAKAYADLSRAYRQKAFYFAPQDLRLQEQAFAAAEKALMLEPDLAEAHLARGFLLWTPYHHFDHEAAAKEYQRALALNPNLDEALHQLGNIYTHVGLLDKGLAKLKQSVVLNPSNSVAQFHMAVALEYQGNYQEALSVFERTRDFANPSLWTYEVASTQFRSGRTPEAAATVREFMAEHSDGGGLLTSMRAVILAAMNQPRQAQESIRLAMRARGKGFIHYHHTAYNIAVAYSLLHNPTAAVKWLQIAANDGFPCYPLMARDSAFDSLRKDPLFIDFMERLKKRWERYEKEM